MVNANDGWWQQKQRRDGVSVLAGGVRSSDSPRKPIAARNNLVTHRSARFRASDHTTRSSRSFSALRTHTEAVSRVGQTRTHLTDRPVTEPTIVSSIAREFSPRTFSTLVGSYQTYCATICPLLIDHKSLLTLRCSSDIHALPPSSIPCLFLNLYRLT